MIKAENKKVTKREMRRRAVRAFLEVSQVTNNLSEEELDNLVTYLKASEIDKPELLDDHALKYFVDTGCFKPIIPEYQNQETKIDNLITICLLIYEDLQVQLQEIYLLLNMKFPKMIRALSIGKNNRITSIAIGFAKQKRFCSLLKFKIKNQLPEIETLRVYDQNHLVNLLKKTSLNQQEVFKFGSFEELIKKSKAEIRQEKEMKKAKNLKTEEVMIPQQIILKREEEIN